MRYIIYVAIIVGLLSGCAGHQFNDSNVSKLQTNITTPQEAIALLGTPHDQYTNEKGNHITWMYAVATMGYAPDVKTLQLRFNNDTLTCVRVLSGFNSEIAEKAGLIPCPETKKGI